VSETSSRIQAGPQPLEHLRPDLPARVQRAVAGALALSPARRPPAARLAEELRTPTRKRAPLPTSRLPNVGVPTRAGVLGLLDRRGIPALLAAIVVGWLTSTLAFYPAGWPLGLAALAGVVAAASPRLGLAFALAACFFPLANISQGLAVVFAILAAAWLAVTWRDARAGLLFVAGPLLAPIAALGFLPLVAQLSRGQIRRALQVALAVPMAALVAGLSHEELPFVGSPFEHDLGLAGSDNPRAVAGALWEALASYPALIAEAGVLAAATLVLPLLRGRGAWPAAAYGAALLAGTALVAPATPLLPLVAAAWVTAAVLVAPRHELH
jgi:hypothetical protein